MQQRAKKWRKTSFSPNIPLQSPQYPENSNYSASLSFPNGPLERILDLFFGLFSTLACFCTVYKYCTNSQSIFSPPSLSLSVLEREKSGTWKFSCIQGLKNIGISAIIHRLPCHPQKPSWNLWPFCVDSFLKVQEDVLESYVSTHTCISATCFVFLTWYLVFWYSVLWICVYKMIVSFVMRRVAMGWFRMEFMGLVSNKAKKLLQTSRNLIRSSFWM